MSQTRKGFTGRENHSVTQAEIAVFTNAYREQYDDPSTPGGVLGKAAASSLLDQPGAVGIRYYYARNESNNEPLLIFTAADRQRNDLLADERIFVSQLNPSLDADGQYNALAADHHISLAEAAELTAAYQHNQPPDGIKGGFFGKDAILSLLNQDDCAAMRFYYGVLENGKRVLCLMGVDTKGADMFYGWLLERSVWCPPLCGEPNCLNSSINIGKVISEISV